MVRRPFELKLARAMKTFDEVVVVLPNADTRARWKLETAAVDSQNEPLIKLQAELLEILPADAEVLESVTLVPWLILWTRVYQGLNGLRGAIDYESPYSAEIIQRALFETCVHVMAIGRPIQDGKSLLPFKLGLEAAQERLVAYLTWCLWKDAERWRELLRPTVLRGVFDPRPARDYAARYGPEELVERFGEDFETLTDAEAERERTGAEHSAREHMAKIRRWLEDERLSPYVEQLRSQKPDSFLGLVNEAESSIFKLLEQYNAAFAYQAYSSGSTVIHGSTLEGILYSKGNVMAPQLGSDADDFQEAIRYCSAWSRMGLIGLNLIRPRPRSA